MPKQMQLDLRGDVFLRELNLFEMLYGVRCDEMAEGDMRGHILGAYPLPKGSGLANRECRKLPFLQNPFND